jgi:WD40 repeat protein
MSTRRVGISFVHIFLLGCALAPAVQAADAKAGKAVPGPAKAAAKSSAESPAAAPAGSPALVLQTAHGGSVLQAVSSPDRRLLATLDSGAVKLWDISSGLQLREFALPPCNYYRLAFVATGAELAVGGACNYASQDVLIDIATGKQKVLKLQPGVSSSAHGTYSPDGLQVMLPGVRKGNFNAQRQVFSLIDGRHLYTLPGEVTGSETVVWREPGAMFTLGRERGWELFDPTKPAERIALLGGYDQSAPVRSPDGRTIAFIHSSAAANSSIHYTTVRLQQGNALVGELKPVHPSAANPRLFSISYSPDGKRLYALGAPGANEANFRITFDVETKKQVSLETLGRSGGMGVGNIRTWFVNDGRQVVASTLKYQLSVWDTPSATLLRELAPQSASIDRVAFSPDGRFLAHNRSSYGEPAYLQVWDLSLGRVVRTAIGSARCLTMGFTPDGKHLAWSEGAWSVGGGTGSGIHLLNLATGEVTHVFKTQATDSFAFSPDGQWVAVATRVMHEAPFASQVTVLDRGTGKAVFTVPGSEIHFSSDSTRLLVADALGDKKGALIEVGRWKVLKDTEGGRLFANPDLSRVATITTYGGGPVTLIPLNAKTTANSGAVFYAANQVHGVAIAPDNGRYAIGGTRVGALVDAATRKPVRDLAEEHPLELQGVAFSPDGRWLATSGQEGSVVLRDPKTGVPRVTLLAGDDLEGLAVLTTGEYMGSRGAMRKVGFRVGLRAYPFEQFDLKFNRPDVVLETLGKASRPMIEAAARARGKRLARAGFTEDMLKAEFRLPEVELDRAAIPASTRDSTARLSIRASDGQVMLDRLLITVNDVPFDGRIGGIDLRSENTRSISRQVDVPLLAGRNRIAVSVLNAQGVESLREVVEIRGDAPAKPGKVFVLAIGVSNYLNPAMNLQYAAKDAKDVAAAFAKAPRIAGAQAATVLDAAATREGIRAARTALQQAEPNDQVVVFVAGHGLLDDRLDYYFATTDIDPEQPAARGLAFEELEGLLDGVKARRKMLLVDTCNSGELDKTEVDAQQTLVASADPRIKVRSLGARALKRKEGLASGDLSGLLADFFADLRRGSGAVVISSSGGAEFALESDEWKNGVFTFAMLEGLRSGAADRDRNGSVTASELRDFVQGQVRKLTNGAQSPTARRENLAVDFVVY